MLRARSEAAPDDRVDPAASGLETAPPPRSTTRIVIDTRMLEWTGIGRYTRHLLEELAVLDQHTHYVVLVPPSAAGSWRSPGENFEPRVADPRPYGAAEQWRLPGILRSLRPDLVHFTHSNVPVRYGGAYIVSVHDLTMLRYRNVESEALAERLRYEVKLHALRWTVAREAHRARLVLTPSGATAADITRTFGRDPDATPVIHMASGTLTGVPEPVPGVDPGEPFLLHVGNFYPHKNLEMLVATMELLNADHPRLRLVLAGAPNWFSDRLAAAGGLRAGGGSRPHSRPGDRRPAGVAVRPRGAVRPAVAVRGVRPHGSGGDGRRPAGGGGGRHLPTRDLRRWRRLLRPPRPRGPRQSGGRGAG